MPTHKTHPEILKRLKRALGNLKGVIEMMENDRECLEVAQQLQAVEKAISNAKKNLVHDHIDHCLENAVKLKTTNLQDTVLEFKEITKYL
ncbi:DNA-binding FrmR family transcriptional regulator [Oxalobacteraceae bacterium GrIS 2.11]